MPEGAALEAFATALEAAQVPALLLMGGAPDRDRVRQAIRVGIQDVLPRRNLTGEVLGTSIQVALERQRRGVLGPFAEDADRIPNARMPREVSAIKDLVLENSTLGIAFVHNRKFAWVNTRMGEMVGRPARDLLGVSTRVIYPDDSSYREMGRIVYSAMERGERSEATWQLQRGDGSIFWSRMIGRPLDTVRPDEGSVWMLEDITDRIDAEQKRLSLEVQLRHAQKLEAVGQLASGIAHEINTPTQFIGDNLKFISEALESLFQVLDAQEGSTPAFRKVCDAVDLPFLREEIPKAVEQSLEGLGRVSKIVKAMKDFSHPGSDLHEEVDLNRSIESTITISRNEWRYVSQLITDLDPQLPPVTCYPNEINQAILNLVVNAAHAIGDRVHGSEELGTITVSTRLQGGSVEIRVSDTGTGIPEQVRGRIFDPFFTTKAVGKGTGQGLAIVHAVIVERHKGTLTFETEIGKGTTFILGIPVAGPRPGEAP